MRKYTTIQGDTWDMISLRCYADEKFMHVLIEANPEYRDIVIFSANIEINVPEITERRQTSFPPWRR